MSKKALLEEGSVRQFMKLANLKPLAEEFVTEMYSEKVEEQEVNEEEETVTEGETEEAVTESEESLEEGSCGEKNEEAVNEETEEVTEELGEEDDAAPDMADMAADAPDMADAGEPEAAGTADKEEMLRDVVNAVAKVLDVDVNFGDGEAEAEAEMDMDAGEEAADMAMADDAAADLDDAPAMRQYDEEFDLDAVVAEVTKRVKDRLLDTKE